MLLGINNNKYQINLEKRLLNQFRKHCQSKQQPLRGQIYKSFGKGGEPYMGGLNILWGGLYNPLETMEYIYIYILVSSCFGYIGVSL